MAIAFAAAIFGAEDETGALCFANRPLIRSSSIFVVLYTNGREGLQIGHF